MAFLTIELNDADYYTLRMLSQAISKPLAHYARDIVVLTIGDVQRLNVLVQEMDRKYAVERLIQPPEVDALIRQVHDQTCDCAPSHFNATTWVVNWLRRPLPALGYRRPEEYLRTETGLQLVTLLVRSMVPAMFWCEDEEAARPT